MASLNYIRKYSNDISFTCYYIIMEKLIELLNKFERETFPEEHEYVRFPDWTDDDWWYWYYKEQPNMWENKWFNYSSRSDKRNCEINQLLIISKEFWFIKWLVENDKIDFENNYLSISKTYIEEYPKYESLLMLLSISDTPIEDLILYLK